MQWKYSYADGDNISLMQYYQDGKLFYTENNFKTNADQSVAAFTRTYANGKTPTESHYFKYYANGKLQKHYFTKEKNGKTLTEGEEIKWYADKVEVFSGNPNTGEYFNKTIYLLDENGNIKNKQTYYLLAHNKVEKAGSPFIYDNYDNKTNPDQLRKNYISEKIISNNNPGSELMESSSFGVTKISYQYNAAQLPISSKTLYDNGNYNIEHTTSYTYQTTSKGNNVAKSSSLNKIFEIAKSVNANTIQKMTYDGTDVYLIINTFYDVDGAVAFKVIPAKTRIYEPPIDKNKLKLSLGKWAKDKNGNYIALR